MPQDEVVRGESSQDEFVTGESLVRRVRQGRLRARGAQTSAPARPWWRVGTPGRRQRGSSATHASRAPAWPRSVFARVRAVSASFLRKPVQLRVGLAKSPWKSLRSHWTTNAFVKSCQTRWKRWVSDTTLAHNQPNHAIVSHCCAMLVPATCGTLLRIAANA